MAIRAIVALGLVPLVGCGHGEGASPAAREEEQRVVRLASWNVHDLFDQHDRLEPPGQQDELLTPGALDAKLASIGRVLAPLDADVIVLQEVENVALLERLASVLLGAGRYRPFLREGNDPRGIDVGVLSRLAFTPGPSHLAVRGPDGRPLWTRDLLELQLETAPRLVVLGAHLVSRLDPDDDDRRAQQARAIRERASDLERAGSCPVVIGDLNDLAWSATLSSLLGEGAFVDLGATAAPEWTWSGGGARERIDYALVPSRSCALPLRFDVITGGDVTAASDHRPLVVDLWLSRQPNGLLAGSFRGLGETATAPSR